MAQVKIIAQTKSVQIGEEEFPKNVLTILTDRDTSVSIRRVVNNQLVVDMQPYTEYRDSTGAPYANFAALITALRAALYL